MVCDTQHFHAMRLKALFHHLQVIDAADIESDVVDPSGCVGGGLTGKVVAQIEEGNERAVLQLKKEMGVRTVFTCAWNMVVFDHMVERQTQNIFIKMTGFFGIPCSVSVVV